MHAIEKIFAQHSGRDCVKTGEIITADVDFAEINDLYLQTIYSFREMGGTKVWDNEKAAFVFDHYAPSPTIKAAQNHKEMREFRQEQNLKYHFDTHYHNLLNLLPFQFQTKLYKHYNLRKKHTYIRHFLFL